MLKRMTAVAAAVALWTGAAAADQPTERLRAAFAVADVNEDGHVDIDEYVAYFIQAFRELDVRGRGFLTLDQFRNPDPDRFAMADRDGDGRISLGEAVADRVIVFFEIASDDGTITLDDLLAYEASR